MNEQYFEIYRVCDRDERREMQTRVNEMITNGWRVVHLSGTGAKDGVSPCFGVVFEKPSQNPCIQ